MLRLYPFPSRARSPYIWCSERGRFLDIPHSVRRYDYHIHFLTNFNVFSVPDLIKKEMSAMYKLIRSTVYQVPKPWSNLAMACCLSVAAGSGYRCMSALLLLLAEDSQAVCSCWSRCLQYSRLDSLKTALTSVNCVTNLPSDSIFRSTQVCLTGWTLLWCKNNNTYKLVWSVHTCLVCYIHPCLYAAVILSVLYKPYSVVTKAYYAGRPEFLQSLCNLYKRNQFSRLRPTNIENKVNSIL